MTLSVGNFSVGIAGEYFHDIAAGGSGGESSETDSWTAGIGMAYVLDAWTFGAQYAHREVDAQVNFDGIDNPFDIMQDRAVLTAIYALGPGITVDGELGYTWLDTDPGLELFGDPEGLENYDAFELGIGTTLTF